MLRRISQTVQPHLSHIHRQDQGAPSAWSPETALDVLSFPGAKNSELRLPITVPNPAHAQFIARESTDPRDETKALSASTARQLEQLPAGEEIIDYRDRAILKVFLYSAIQLSTGVVLKSQTSTRTIAAPLYGCRRKATSEELLVSIMPRPRQSSL